MKIFFLFAFFLLFVTLPAFAREPVPHPRLYLSQSGGKGTPGVEQLRRRIRRPDYTAAWERVLRSESAADRALVFLLTGDTTRLDGVRKALGETVNRYEPLVERSLAFDWAYEALSDQERSQFAARLIESARATARRYRLTTVYHNMCRGRNMGQGLAMLAAWDDDPAAKELLPTVEAELQEFLKILGDGVPVSDMAGRAGYGGGWPEGYDYDRHGSFYALQLLLAWRSAGLGDYLSASSYWRDKVYWLVYGTSPDGSFLLPYEDNDWPMILRQDREMMTLISAEFRSGHGRRWLDRFADKLQCRPYWDLLFSDPTVQAEPLSELPASRLIPGLGLALMRSSWSERASFVHFHCGPWYTYHQHAAQGSFTVYRDKPLVVEPGVYNGEVDGHNVNWRIRTISHNCITVLDTAERFLGPNEVPEPANDGGQIINNWTLKPGTLEQWRAQRKMRDTGQITAFLPDLSHDLVAGEAAQAYNPEKVRRWCRQLLFIKPGWVVLCDLVEAAGAGFPKTLLLHTPEKILVKDGWAEAVDRSVVIYPLLPEGVVKEVAGGPDEPFTYNGKSWPGVPAYNHQYDTAWRLELKAPAARETTFLTVLYFPEASTADKALPGVELVEVSPGRVALTLAGGSYRLAFDPRAERPYELSGRGISYSISGAVLDERGLPVENAAVGLEGASSGGTLTDNHGRYLFEGLRPGGYTVVLQDSGQRQSLRITNHNLGEVNFE